MKRFLPLFLLVAGLMPGAGWRVVNAQTCIRDIYASAPDSIFPLLTRNNRLDQIDFYENDMPAVVKNRFDDRAELLVLTDCYLKLRHSDHMTVEMRLLCDSTFCMVQTYTGPAADSRIRLFDTTWHEIGTPWWYACVSHLRPEVARKPAVADFLSEDIDTDTRHALEALPLIKATLSEEAGTITFELQTTELTREQREKAEGKVMQIIKKLEM